MMCLNILKKGNISMEEKLLKLFKLADSLNEKQEKLFAEITYCANNSKTLTIYIRSKIDFSYIEKCEIQLNNNSNINWNNIISLFETFIGGVVNE